MSHHGITEIRVLLRDTEEKHISFQKEVKKKESGLKLSEGTENNRKNRLLFEKKNQHFIESPASASESYFVMGK